MKLRYVALASLMVFLALCILFVSLSRASLVQVKEKLGRNSYHNILISLVSNTLSDSGEDAGTKNYNLPEVTVLPTSPFYGFKRIRDFLWVKFCLNSVVRGKLELLLADKKMSEAVKMIANNNVDEANEAVGESLDYLKQAYTDLSDSKEGAESAKQLMVQARASGKAYEMIIKNLGVDNVVNGDNTKRVELLNGLTKWNEKISTQTEE